MEDNVNIDEIAQVEKEAQEGKDVPLGYEEFRLSTLGKKGAPEVFHAKNFDYGEMFALGSITEKNMAIKLPEMFAKVIHEKNVDVKDFLDAEFTEFMARFLATYYQSKIEIPYTVTKEDKKWVVDHQYDGNDKDPRYKDWLLSIQSGETKPTLEVDLTQLDFYDVNEAPNRVAYHKTYPSGKTFDVEFRLPKFGDSAILAKAVEEKFAEQDRKFATTYENYKYNQELKARRMRNELVDMSTQYYIPENELNAVKQYELEKTAYTIALTKGLYLASIDGVDVSEKKFSERVELAKDPRLDYNAMQMLTDEMKNIHIGIVPKITCRHPIKGVVETIDHNFRSLELLTHLQQYRSDNASVNTI